MRYLWDKRLPEQSQQLSMLYATNSSYLLVEAQFYKDEATTYFEVMTTGFWPSNGLASLKGEDPIGY